MKLSIIMPAFNEKENIRYIHNEILKNFDSLGENLEIIFVDDGSSDNTWSEIGAVNKMDGRVRGFRFSRNFGHQIAVLAGLRNMTGDIAVIMDSDGQHPPEVVHRLIEEHKKGFDVVNTIRKANADGGFLKKYTSLLYRRILNYLSDTRISFEQSDFRLMTRRAVDSYLEIEEQNRFSRGLISWIGFPQTSIEYEALQRHTGITKWNPRKLFRLGIDGITSFSSKPLRISFAIGLFAIIIGLMYAAYAIVVHFTGNTVPGWPSMMVTILLLGGFQLFSIGILGEYIARIFIETKKRPLYFIREKC